MARGPHDYIVFVKGLHTDAALLTPHVLHADALHLLDA
jgi:hypothetical protein